MTIFGGSSADESVVNGGEPGGWWQLCGTAGGAWRVTTNSVVMAGLYLRAPDACQCSVGSCYVPTLHRGLATRTAGRVVHTIGGEPAAKVLDAWCGGALQAKLHGGLVVRETALFPLDVRAKAQMRPRLVHMKRVLPGGAVECFGPVEQGQELRLNSRKLSDFPAAVRELVANALRAAAFAVQLALVEICAGSASAIPDLELLVEQIKDGFAAAVGDSPPRFLCFFTFGEQGMVDGKPAHCNLMVNVALFG